MIRILGFKGVLRKSRALFKTLLPVSAAALLLLLTSSIECAGGQPISEPAFPGRTRAWLLGFERCQE